MVLVKKTNHVTEAQGRIIEKFKNSDNILGVIASFINQIQDLENIAFEVQDDRLNINTVVGTQLDGVGAIVGEERQNRTDDEYRLAIRIRILRNLSDSTPEDILDIFDLWHTGTYELTEYPPAAFILLLQEALTASDSSPVRFAQLLDDIKGAGINASFIYNAYPLSQKFKFARGDTVGSSSVYGFGNDTGTTGGHWVDVSDPSGLGEVVILWTLAGEILRTLADDVLIER